ncbi:MAG: Biotin--[acetyl-CoA-carboxylase] synthetase [Burkholderia sp.]|nr:Biotin--[acetyl-CoA-carboxylase] synthetase [Burkholderia sp.]
MQGMIIMLSPERIASSCIKAARQVTVRVVDETGSTNADLLAGVDQLTGPTLLVAEKQTAGRGRAGRVWHSAPGASLTFSLAWKFSLPVHALVGLPLAVGTALAESLATFDVPARLKWPNDVLVEGKKLAGILIETASVANTARGESWAVTGVGLNLTVPDSIAAQIDRPVASIPRLAQMDRDMLIATLLNGLSEAMAQFEQEGLAAFMQRWNSLHAYSGQQTVILDHGRVVHEGRAVGIDDIGRFVLDTASGRVAVIAGDVSLRVLNDAAEHVMPDSREG